MKKIYRGNKRQEICFPLGGIGTGSIGLDGTGRLRDWEIFNRPDKGSVNGFSHFGVKAEKGGRTVDARVLNADLMGSYMGRYVEKKGHAGYGYGPDRHLMSGVPHFRDCEFAGEFPLAQVRFLDETFPGKVTLDAFNPFIPSDPDGSSIPAAFFSVEIVNDTGEELAYTLALSVNNPSSRAHIHRIIKGKCFQGIELADDLTDDMDPKYGSIVFGIPAGDDMQVQRYWYRGSWFDNLSVFWQDLTAPGALRDRNYEEPGNAEDIATVAVRTVLAPGGVWRQRFLIGWHYPNCVNYWKPANQYDPAEDRGRVWKNWYASLFADAPSAAEYAMAQWDRLYEETLCFHDALYSSTLPEEALEAVGSNIAVLKSPTVFRLTDGQFYGFEGCSCDAGSCEGSCTHVWNYAMALPFLFPSLERSMRELDYTYNLREDGGMPFRLQLPLGSGRWRFWPCVDGQMGGIIKTYREWKLSGDDEWLAKWWPKVKLSLEYAWSPQNADKWDPGRTGVITGRQHHTLDMELFGPNAWLNGFYIGALKAASEMANAMGDGDAALYLELARRGREYMDRELFNGEYYFQKIDIRDKGVPESFRASDRVYGGDVVGTYWNEEAGQIKYQIGEGCGIDQLLGQWMCEMAGVGEILDPSHVSSALRAIYRHNFKPSLRDHFNPCRIYGLNDEAGMVICDWPEGREKPVVPVPYAEECMHGFEYQAACHMISKGLEEEGLNVVRGIRARYDGEKRNPWNEMECGSNYARSMASYALMLIYSGFRFDMRLKRMGMLPIRRGRYFWSLDGAWGTFTWLEGKAELNVLYGNMELGEWVIPEADKVRKVLMDTLPIPYRVGKDALLFDGSLRLAKGTRLTCVY